MMIPKDCIATFGSKLIRKSLFGAGLLVFSAGVFAQDSVFQIGSESSAQQGAELSIPVDMVDNNHSITQFQVDVVYDSANLTLRGGGDADNSGLTGCDFIDKGTANPNKAISCSEPDGAGAGRLRVAVDDSGSDAGPLNEGTLFFIRINVDNDAGFATYPLTSENEEAFDGVTPVTAFQTNDGEITVVDIAPNLALSPASLTFSAENGSTSPAQTATACNDGNADGLTFSGISISGADAANFDQTNNCPTSSPGLAQGACCQIDTTFSPDAVASFAASLDVTSSNGSGSVTLEGTGTAGPASALSISPTSHDFGDVLTGDSATQTFTVSNSGDADSNASIDTITPPTGEFTVSGGTCTAGSTTLSDGESCTIVLDFAPTADGAQGPSDLVVDGTDTINSTSLQATSSVQGTGVTEARFSSDPAPGGVNMGLAPPGGSLNQTVVVSNEGNANLTVNNCTLNDPDGLFSITPDPIDFSIAPDGSDSFAVSCNVPAPGSFSASLSCDTNDPNNAAVSYTFTCNGQILEIPTMQPWGLVLLTMLMLMIGGLSIRYFRV
jgi:hypothetical protein